MKKLTILLLILTVVLTSAAAEELTNSNEFYKISHMLEQDMDPSDPLIAELSENLTPSEKLTIYESHEMDAYIPFSLNLFIGSGVGSFVQGDIKGGSIAICGDLASSLLLIIAYKNSAQDDSYELTTWEQTLATAGVVGIIGFRLYELVRPYTYAWRYNSALADSLMSNSSFAMVPVIQPEGDMGMAMVASINF